MTASAVEKPGSKIQVVYLLIRQRGGGIDQTALDGFLLDPDFVETGTVIPNFDDDTVGVVIGVEIQGAAGGFACQQPLFCRFDTVIHRVSDQMHQWVTDLLYPLTYPVRSRLRRSLSVISLFSSWLTSRTTRWKRLKVSPIGTIRRRSALSRISSTSMAMTEVASCS